MAASSNGLADLIRRKIVRIPNLRPKTKLGQRTIGVNQSETVFQQLKGEYYENPIKLQPFVDYLKERILEDEALATAPEGIYTWILKQGHLYAMGLMSNQEIGSLHVNIDVLTLHQNNVDWIHKNTLKNRRGDDAKPVAAGEVLIVRKEEAGTGADEVTLYFNLQSGTYSEPLLKCRAVALGEQHGLNKKELKGAMERLKRECRDDMVEEVQQAISRATGVPMENVRFLTCSEKIQRELEGVRLLETGYVHGACRDDEDYMESIAGRNLIRRFMATTLPENMERFQSYFHVSPSSSFTSSVPSASSVPSVPSVLGKRRMNTRNNKNKGNNKNTGNNKNIGKNKGNNKNKNQTRKR